LLKGLYTILKNNENEIVIQLANNEHPIFKAHFPNHPILPGFIIIDIMAEILNDKIIYIKQSKFILPLLPNDLLLCKYNKYEKRSNIKIYKNEKKVSEISYESK